MIFHAGCAASPGAGGALGAAELTGKLAAAVAELATAWSAEAVERCDEARTGSTGWNGDFQVAGGVYTSCTDGADADASKTLDPGVIADGARDELFSELFAESVANCAADATRVAADAWPLALVSDVEANAAAALAAPALNSSAADEALVAAQLPGTLNPATLPTNQVSCRTTWWRSTRPTAPRQSSAQRRNFRSIEARPFQVSQRCHQEAQVN